MIQTQQDMDLDFLHLYQNIINTIESVDAKVGSLMTAIQQRPNYANEDWLILVTSDHGGLGTSHGGNSIEEQNVPFIASSAFITPQFIEKSSTISPPAVDCLSNSIELQFDGNNDYVQIADNSLFNFGNSRDFTVECRVRTDESADVAIVGNKNWSSGFNKGFVFSFK
jgi:hypothetical protein